MENGEQRLSIQHLLYIEMATGTDPTMMVPCTCGKHYFPSTPLHACNAPPTSYQFGDASMHTNPNPVSTTGKVFVPSACGDAERTESREEPFVPTLVEYLQFASHTYAPAVCCQAPASTQPTNVEFVRRKFYYDQDKNTALMNYLTLREKQVECMTEMNKYMEGWVIDLEKLNGTSMHRQQFLNEQVLDDNVTPADSVLSQADHLDFTDKNFTEKSEFEDLEKSAPRLPFDNDLAAKMEAIKDLPEDGALGNGSD